MNTFGSTIRSLRESKKLPLRTVAAILDIDQAILSRIERGERKAQKEHVSRLAQYFDTPEKELMIAWLSDKILYEIEDEAFGYEALIAAEEQVKYQIIKIK
jgi:transcriptional regulator with XRE-family HTH domain